MDKITVGAYVVYTNDHKERRCRVGHVLTVARTEHCVVVHRMAPLMDGALRLRWLKVYQDQEGHETHEPGAKAAQEYINHKIIQQLQIKS